MTAYPTLEIRVLASVFSSYVHPHGKRNYEIAVFIKKNDCFERSLKKNTDSAKKKKGSVILLSDFGGFK